MKPLLEIDHIHTYYDHIHAVKGVHLTVNEGEIVTLIGGNGAGKSTTLNTVCGITPAKRGRVLFDGKDITSLPTHQIVELGITQVPEGRRIFAPLSVLENLELGAYCRKDKAGIHDSIEEIFGIFPRLKERQHQAGGTLSGGEQQMLAVGRALMAKPRLLVLDEPSMGLAPLLVQEIFRVIRRLNEQGTTILLVEQNAHAALAICHRAYALQTGQVVLSGDRAALLHNDVIRSAYLG